MTVVNLIRYGRTCNIVPETKKVKLTFSFLFLRLYQSELAIFTYFFQDLRDNKTTM